MSTETVKMGHTQNIESEINTDSSIYNKVTMGLQLIHEEYNSAYNHHNIIERFKAGKARDLGAEPKANGAPAMIIFSGPTLDKQIHLLKQWKGGIICTTSHALTLMRYGVEPTHILALDPFCMWEEIRGVDWSKTRTKLITQPGVWPDLIENWPNDILLFYQNIRQPQGFYETTQRHMYTWREGDRKEAQFHILIPTGLVSFACSPPAQMFAAKILGYGNLILVGADISYSDGKDRFTNWTVKKPSEIITTGNAQVEVPAEWEEHVHPIAEREQGGPLNQQIITSNSGVQTTIFMLYYKKNVYSAWRMECQQCFVTSDNTVLDDMPHISIEESIISQGNLPGRDKEWIIKHSERYLASIGAYVLQAMRFDGVEQLFFVESAHPEPELYYFMLNLLKPHFCPTCKASINAEDGIDHTGGDCPNCKNKGVVRIFKVDIDENIRRVRGLIAYVEERKNVKA